MYVLDVLFSFVIFVKIGEWLNFLRVFDRFLDFVIFIEINAITCIISPIICHDALIWYGLAAFKERCLQCFT